MSATVKAGERGFDSSFSHPPVARTIEMGFTFRVGYISIPPASPGKNITIQECIDTVNAGQKLNLVFEMSATRATLGAAYGAVDGAAAKQQAQLRGQPVDVPIIMADDTSTTVANLPKKVAYFEAAAETCKPFDIGIYGGVKILRATAGLWKIGWVPITAWSWSVSLAKLPNETSEAYNKRGRAAARQAAIDIGAHCLQDTGFYIDNTWAVDPNEAIADFPAWSNSQDDALVQGDTDMITANDICKAEESPGDKFVLMSNGRLRPIGQIELKLLGIPLTLELGKPVNAADRATLGAYGDTGGDIDTARLAKLETITVALNDAVGRTGQVIGDIQKGLGQAADARA